MLILKDAYVLTLNPLNDFGRYTIAIEDNKIADIISSEHDSSNEKIERLIAKCNPSDVIDCSSRIIMPAFVNSCLKSEGSLIKYLLQHRHYELHREDLTTDFMLNYIFQELPTSEVMEDLNNIYEYSLARELKSGILFLNEVTPRKDTNHFEPLTHILSQTRQTANICYQIKQGTEQLERYNKLNFSIYLTDETQITIYDLSVLNELKSSGVCKLFLEVAVNKSVTDNFRKLFNKPIVVLLDEYGLIDEETSLINPLYLTYDELKIINERHANIIICPKDLTQFTGRYFPFDDFLNHNIKFSVATGWLGEDLFQELRLLRNRFKELNLSSKALLESVTKIPKTLYFKGDNTPYYIDKGKNADLVFINLDDIRFQFYPENLTFEKLCDYIIDNLSVYNISDVMSKGKFVVRNGVLLNQIEKDIIRNAENTRQRLYKVGKYYELLERDKQKKYVEDLDLRARDRDEIILFSDTSGKEAKDEPEEFRIKGKLNTIRKKTADVQNSLFDEDKIPVIRQAEEEDSPLINLLVSDLKKESKIDEELNRIRLAEAKILKENISEKKDKKLTNDESRVELPKNVKLKFGDD